MRTMKNQFSIFYFSLLDQHTLSQPDVNLAENIRLIYQYALPNKTQPNM